MRLDDTNIRILGMLQEDGRTTIADLARLTGRSESTVRERFRRLQEDGVLRAIRADIDLDRVGYGAVGYLRAQVDPGDVLQIKERLARVPEVRWASMTTGKYPLLVEIRGSDIRRLERVVESELDLPGVRRPGLELVTRRLVEPEPFPLLNGD